jgi:hypothetical protein
MKVKEWIKMLQKSNPEESVCIHMWQVEDVIEQAKEIGKRVTKNEAQEILEEIEDNIDSELGVSWTTIRIGIEDFIRTERKNK